MCLKCHWFTWAAFSKKQLSISPCHTLKTWTQDNRRRISQSQGYRNIFPIGPLHSTGLLSAIKYDSLDSSFIGCSYLPLKFIYLHNWPYLPMHQKISIIRTYIHSPSQYQKKWNQSLSNTLNFVSKCVTLNKMSACMFLWYKVCDAVMRQYWWNCNTIAMYMNNTPHCTGQH